MRSPSEFVHQHEPSAPRMQLVYLILVLAGVTSSSILARAVLANARMKTVTQACIVECWLDFSRESGSRRSRDRESESEREEGSKGCGETGAQEENIGKRMHPLYIYMCVYVCVCVHKVNHLHNHTCVCMYAFVYIYTSEWLAGGVYPTRSSASSLGDGDEGYIDVL